MTPKSDDICPKWVPKWFQNGPMGGQNRPMGAQNAQDGAKWPLGTPRCAQGGGSRGPSWSQERFQGAQDETKMAPREPQKGSKMDQRKAKGSSKGAQEEPKTSKRDQVGGSKGAKGGKVDFSKSLNIHLFL